MIPPVRVRHTHLLAPQFRKPIKGYPNTPAERRDVAYRILKDEALMVGVNRLTAIPCTPFKVRTAAKAREAAAKAISGSVPTCGTPRVSPHQSTVADAIWLYGSAAEAHRRITAQIQALREDPHTDPKAIDRWEAFAFRVGEEHARQEREHAEQQEAAKRDNMGALALQRALDPHYRTPWFDAAVEWCKHPDSLTKESRHWDQAADVIVMHAKNHGIRPRILAAAVDLSAPATYRLQLPTK